MPIGTTPLFRYVAVRPVQTHNPARENIRFLRPPEPLTPLREQLKNASGWTAARKVARTFILSEAWMGSRLESDPNLIALRTAYRALKNAVPADAAGNLRTRVHSLIDIEIRPEALAPLNNDLWDSLITTYLAPRVRARDRAGLIDCLRVLHYLFQPPSPSAEDVRDIVRATPLIPEWIGSRGITASPAPVDDIPGGTIDPGTSLETVRKLRSQVLQLDIANDDLDLAYSHARRESRRRPPDTSPTPAPVPAPLPTPDPRRAPPQIPERPPGNSWRNTVIGREQLKPATPQVLDGIDPVWEYRSQDEVLETIRVRRATLVSKLRRAGGGSATAGLEARTAPIDRGDLETDDFEFPPGVPTAPSFTETIEGSVGHVRPVGVGDLLIVQEALLGYEEVEIATIENVMSTESMNRVFRKLDRTTTTTFTSSEKTETTERDLESTQRYELQSEATETITNQMSIATGINISASYGPMVEVDASADFSVDNTTENSTTTASNFAQDVVDKSVSNLTQSLKEEITVRVMSETEETASHGFNNDTGAHVVGVYRWLNKNYQAQVHNYGKRLLLEFMVPQPAAFYRHAQKFAIGNDPTLQPPEPLEEGFAHTDIEPENFGDWVARYHVAGVSPPPPLSQVVTKFVDLPQAMDHNGIMLMTRGDSLIVPTGYVAKEGWANYTGAGGIFATMFLAMGQTWLVGNGAFDLDNEEGSIPLGVLGWDYVAAVVTFEARCERTVETLRAWRLETYQKIVDTYDAQQAEYEANVKAREASQMSSFTGIPPEAKRIIERTELKKGCLQLLTNQHFYDFDATVVAAAPFGYPEFDVAEAMSEGSYSQFYELCCEWNNATWFYYPYFWGRKDQWMENSTVTDSDPIFESFLRAGMARVQVPVRPGYGKALLYYLHTGEIWNGGEPPVLDSPLYVSIVEEIAESQDVSLADAPPYGDPWTYSLPTNLVKLQADATLPSWPAP